MELYEKSKTADILKRARKETGQTQCDIAKKTGLSKMTVFKIEKGLLTPKITTVLAWLRACDRRVKIVKETATEVTLDIFKTEPDNLSFEE